MREIDRSLRTDGPGRLRERLTSTPFTSLIADDHVTDRHPLSRGERANVALVFFFAQAMQVVFFAWLVFGFFVVFGALAVTDVVIAEWVGHPRTDGDLFTLRLPVSNELLQVSLFLSAFSGLYFAGSAATDPHYRKSFFDPLVADVRVSLAAREAYLARWGDQQRSENWLHDRPVRARRGAAYLRHRRQGLGHGHDRWFDAQVSDHGEHAHGS